MYAAGVIVELNPFHNGHEVHIAETRAVTGCKYVVAVMSGNFVQRGEPAICDKWLRTEMALMHGVDVVIELPVGYVIGGADYFARGAVGLLDATGVVHALCFGSESGNLEEIVRAGQVLAEEPPLYREILRNGLDKGLSFAAAKGAALEACLSGKVSDGLLSLPNNGLAMEYCKAVKLLGDRMNVFTTHRRSGGPSATAIRKELRGFGNLDIDYDTQCTKPAQMTEKYRFVSEFVPVNVLQILKEAPKFASLDDFSDVFRYLLYAKPDAADGLGEGLGNRFRRMCGEYSKISEILSAVKTKRYVYTRLQRAVCGILLGIGAAEMTTFEQNGGVQYIRVLGFRKASAEIVGEIVRKARLPVITHGVAIDSLLAGGDFAAKMLEQELVAGDIYRIASGEPGGYRSERGKRIVVV